MSTAKERVSEMVQAQPDDSSFDEILRELAFSRMVDTRFSGFSSRPYNL